MGVEELRQKGPRGPIMRKPCETTKSTAGPGVRQSTSSVRRNTAQVGEFVSQILTERHRLGTRKRLSPVAREFQFLESGNRDLAAGRPQNGRREQRGHATDRSARVEPSQERLKLVRREERQVGRDHRLAETRNIQHRANAQVEQGPAQDHAAPRGPEPEPEGGALLGEQSA